MSSEIDYKMIKSNTKGSQHACECYTKLCNVKTSVIHLRWQKVKKSAILSSHKTAWRPSFTN